MSRVTVAIPLHRSARWIDVVTENVRRLPTQVDEILVSDQTCVDDAVDQLRTRIGTDRRVVIRAEDTGIGWQDHYQQLLEQAAGDLFMWMPHDDRFEPGWVPTLAAALDAHPGTWLSFGHMACVEADGSTSAGAWPHPPSGPITAWGVLRMQLQGEMGLAVRGLFRRREVLSAGIRVTPDPSYPPSDMPWAFAVGLEGGFVHDDRATTWKRFYPASTHARWGDPPPGAHERAALAVLRRHGPDGVTGAAMAGALRAAELRARLRPHLGPLWQRALRRPPLPGRD